MMLQGMIQSIGDIGSNASELQLAYYSRITPHQMQGRGVQ